MEGEVEVEVEVEVPVEVEVHPKALEVKAINIPILGMLSRRNCQN